MTPEDRIRREPQLFAGYPAEVQERIRAGRVDIGDDPDAVRLALGDPERKVDRTSAEGRVEVWIYAVGMGKPRVSFSVGVGSGGSRSGYGAGVGLSTGGAETFEEAMRVEFLAGRVVRIETRKD